MNAAKYNEIMQTESLGENSAGRKPQKCKLRDFPGGPAAETLCSRCRGPGSALRIPYAATKSSHATAATLHVTMRIKDPTCHGI